MENFDLILILKVCSRCHTFQRDDGREEKEGEVEDVCV